MPGRALTVALYRQRGNAGSVIGEGSRPCHKRSCNDPSAPETFTAFPQAAPCRRRKAGLPYSKLLSAGALAIVQRHRKLIGNTA